MPSEIWPKNALCRAQEFREQLPSLACVDQTGTADADGQGPDQNGRMANVVPSLLTAKRDTFCPVESDAIERLPENCRELYRAVEVAAANVRDGVAAVKKLPDRSPSLVGVDQTETGEDLKSDGQRTDQNGLMANVLPLTAEEDAVAEANHRIANNLAIIACMVREANAKLKTDPNRANDIATSVLADLSTRIGAIARLHRILTEQRGQAQIDLPKYLREVIEVAKLALADSASHIGFEARAEVEANPRIAEAMGLFLSEAITNALKHADGAYVRVMLRISGGDLLLEVLDNGPGLSPDFDEKNSSGLRLMRSLASQLNGRVELDQCTGLCVRLIMPK